MCTSSTHVSSRAHICCFILMLYSCMCIIINTRVAMIHDRWHKASSSRAKRVGRAPPQTRVFFSKAPHSCRLHNNNILPSQHSSSLIHSTSKSLSSTTVLPPIFQMSSPPLSCSTRSFLKHISTRNLKYTCSFKVSGRVKVSLY